MLSRGDWTWSEFAFPKLFLISTILLIISSLCFERAKSSLKSDNPSLFKKSAKLGLLFGSLFIFSQFGGWIQLQSQGILLAGKPDGSFLYIISAVHALHILVGIAILAIISLKIIKEFGEPVNRLLLVTNKSRLQNFSLAILYWHFVDIVWVYLIFFLLFNHL